MPALPGMKSTSCPTLYLCGIPPSPATLAEGAILERILQPIGEPSHLVSDELVLLGIFDIQQAGDVSILLDFPRDAIVLGTERRCDVLGDKLIVSRFIRRHASFFFNLLRHRSGRGEVPAPARSRNDRLFDLDWPRRKHSAA